MPILICLSLFCISTITLAQSETENILFTFLEQQPEMDSSSTQMLNKILLDTTVENYYFVSVEPIQTLVNDYAIPIAFPFLIDSILPFYTRQVKYVSDTNYVWHGVLVENDSIDLPTGYGTVISREGKKFGSFLVDSFYLDLVDLGGNNNLLVQYKYDSLITQCGIGKIDTLNPSPEPPDSSLIAEYRGTGPCPIKVLILYTNDAKNLVPDINQTVDVAFENTLNALYNSNIKDSEFYLDLVDVKFHSTLIEFIAVGGTVNQLGEPVLPPLEERIPNFFDFLDGDFESGELELIRKNNKADFIVILADLKTYNYDISGFANPGPNKEAPFAVVDARIATKNYTFAHELGHLFGCLHEECSAPWKTDHCEVQNINARHPHRWKSPRFFGIVQRDRFSIMYADDSKHTRGFFSNPNVKTHYGKKTGTQWRNNAEWLKDMGCIISNWEVNETSPLFSHISGPTVGCPCTQVILNANAQGGGPGAYTYNWSYSYNGFSYTDIPGNWSSVNIQMPCSLPSFPYIGQGLFVRLEVIDSYDESHISWTYIELNEEDEYGVPCLFPNNRTAFPYKNKLDISVFPNPTSGVVNIETESLFEDSQILKVHLSNVSGQLLYSDDWKVENGKNQFTVELINYPTGIYFLTFSNATDKQEIETFTIVRQ